MSYILTGSFKIDKFYTSPFFLGLLSFCQNPRGQFTSPNSCKHFVNCWDGTAVEQECPTSTLWNDVYGFCDFAARVDCGTRPLPGK